MSKSNAKTSKPHVDTVGRPSILQDSLQPSSFTLLPSSHISPKSRTPSPQVGAVQSVRHAFASVSELAEPVSHSSTPRKRNPSPQTLFWQDNVMQPSWELLLPSSRAAQKRCGTGLSLRDGVRLKQAGDRSTSASARGWCCATLGTVRLAYRQPFEKRRHLCVAPVFNRCEHGRQTRAAPLLSGTRGRA